MGIVIAQLEVGMLAVILGYLIMKYPHIPPYFSTYVVLRLIQRLILFPILWAYGVNSYSVVYWITAPALTASLFCLLCEFRRSKLLIAVGIALGLAQGLSYYLAGVYGWQHEPTAGIERSTAVLVALVCFIVLVKDRNNLLAMGAMLLAIVPAATYTFAFMLHSRELRFVPDFLYLLGLMAWIVWVRRLEYASPRTSS